MKKTEIPYDRIIDLKNKIELFALKSPERKKLIKNFAEFYGLSVSTIYRRIEENRKPKSLKRSDSGKPRYIEKELMEKYCQIIAALKLRTTNKKNHHLSTKESIRILEEVGVETPTGFVKIPKGLLKLSTANRFLNKYGYDKTTMNIQQVVTRFQANHSNECWHFDLSPSDLKDIEELPSWIDPQRGKPILMLYGIVDDRSGVTYQEYHVVYGEDVEAALRFLFNAMTKKDVDGFPFEGIPKMIYTDNGPVTKSGVFKRVMELLGIEVKKHVPKDKDSRRVSARSKGKIERPFRTIKEVHETLYHFHKPKNEKEANDWLTPYTLRYNDQSHRSEPHSRIEDWIQNIPAEGIKKMCSWERYCTFAREPEKRKVGPDAKISISGTYYDVDPELACQTVISWYGLFDDHIFIEFDNKKFGPFNPTGGPIPLNRFRSYKLSSTEKRKEEIEKLAMNIKIPIEILTSDFRKQESLLRELPENVSIVNFDDPDPFFQLSFENSITAKKAIASLIGIPLAKLTEEDIKEINTLLEQTLEKEKIFSMIKEKFYNKKLKTV